MNKSAVVHLLVATVLPAVGCVSVAPRSGASSEVSPQTGDAAGSRAAASSADASGAVAGSSSSADATAGAGTKETRLPTECASDADCEPGARCDGACVDAMVPGQRCSAGADCTSGVCGRNGVCCGANIAAGVDCCGSGSDCPAEYTLAARCDDLATCQGISGEAACSEGVCGTKPVDDDSACEGESDCGLYARVTCVLGKRDQPDRGCATECRADGDCDPEAAFCQQGRCVERLDDGVFCDRDAQCKTACRDNKICCKGEACCASVADCPKGEGTCSESCATGRRGVVECAQHICVERSTTVDDDSACEGMSFGCGYYKDVSCNAEREQENECLASCETNADCDSGNDCSQLDPDNRVCVIPSSGNSESAGAGGTGGSGG